MNTKKLNGFTYREAGYTVAAVKPLTRLELAKLQVAMIEEIELEGDGGNKSQLTPSQLSLQIATNMAEQDQRVLDNTARIKEIEAKLKLMESK